jgi:hypothetical protein
MIAELTSSFFSDEDRKALEPAMKVGLLATVDPTGLPHLTLISSLKAGSTNTVTWGQFTEGLSKEHIRLNPKTAFLVMTLDRQLWRGKATWTHSANAGADFDWYNNIPMFRYNAYFGIHTVHYMDLVGQTGRQALPMNAIVREALKTVLSRRLAGAPSNLSGMNGWTKALFNKLDNLKFIAYIDADGYPYIIPIIQAQASSSRTILFSSGVYRDELAAIPAGSPVAVFGMALTMEDVLVRGEYLGMQRRAGVMCGVVEVDWVYNSMPPVPGQVYPERPVESIIQF